MSRGSLNGCGQIHLIHFHSEEMNFLALALYNGLWLLYDTRDPRVYLACWHRSSWIPGTLMPPVSTSLQLREGSQQDNFKALRLTLKRSWRAQSPDIQNRLGCAVHGIVFIVGCRAHLEIWYFLVHLNCLWWGLYCRNNMKTLRDWPLLDLKYFVHTKEISINSGSD